MDEGRQVGLCSPLEGDLVGLPPNFRDVGAPSCAKVFFAPLGPDSRLVLVDFIFDSSTGASSVASGLGGGTSSVDSTGLDDGAQEGPASGGGGGPLPSSLAGGGGVASSFLGGGVASSLSPSFL